MATLHITEFKHLPTDTNGNVLPIAMMPAQTQTVTYSTSAQSAAFAEDTKFIRVIADAAAHLAFGSSPTATTSHPWVPSSTPEFFGVKGGDKVAAYDGSS